MFQKTSLQISNPDSAALATLVKMMIVSESWKVTNTVIDTDGTPTAAYAALIEFFGNVVPTGTVNISFAGKNKALYTPDTYTVEMGVETLARLDGQGIVGYARVGDTVVLRTDATGYSKDLTDVFEIPIYNATAAANEFLVIGISEVDETDFYTPFSDATIQALAYIDSGYINQELNLQVGQIGGINTILTAPSVKTSNRRNTTLSNAQKYLR